ncbi:CBS domain-containing protein [Anaeromyxobacter dehalogenans]|uniref:Putative signal-transduction protein with CBS domains n=1 Tax=Anaeromyxobacter dehalogenans (strain 2CP-C) TaxID=290397 RepID=Q2IEQ6_ANADE|nr:CBS domain-containing protein [Anaeromyxobacter dehalogenans]ABC83065.1 putative signal-transduction protein with CBS domains [Anaeromyxobacter dehalogenans 2CP-C]
MRVEQAMSRATGCRERDSVRDCAALMRDEEIGFVPVCNDAGEPVGAITDRDLAIRVLAEGRSADEQVSSCMTREVVACRLGDDLRDAEQLMRQRQLSRVMVCDDDGRLRGVISLADIAEVESERSIGDTVQAVKSDQPSIH